VSTIEHQEAVTVDGVCLQLSAEEARLVVEGLRTLLNARRFSFKEPHEDMRQVHAPLFDLLDRVESELKRAAGR
jgi:hypothetical protein